VEHIPDCHPQSADTGWPERWPVIALIRERSALSVVAIDNIIAYLQAKKSSVFKAKAKSARLSTANSRTPSSLRSGGVVRALRLRCVADLHSHLLAQSRKGRLDFFRLGSMLRIEHTADHSLVYPKAARQLGVVDLLVAHRKIERQLRRKPKRHGHQALTSFAAEDAGISSRRDRRIESSDPRASTASSIAS
jgi:hypothetical protein